MQYQTLKTIVMEKNLTPEESLAIISKNIEQSRKDMLKNGGTPMLVWGGLVFVFSLGIYFLWVLTYNPAWNYLWFVMTAIGYITTAMLSKKKGPKVESFISAVLEKVWLAFGILAIATPSLTIILIRLIKYLAPSSMVTGAVFFPITLITVVLLSLATAITGFILKNKWIAAAGIICGTVGTAFAFTLIGPEQTLLLTGISVIGLIIPGLILNFQSKSDE